MKQIGKFILLLIGIAFVKKVVKEVKEAAKDDPGIAEKVEKAKKAGSVILGLFYIGFVICLVAGGLMQFFLEDSPEMRKEHFIEFIVATAIFFFIKKRFSISKSYVTNTLDSKIAYDLPSIVRNELAIMTPQHQEEFVEEFKRKSKSLGIGYLFLVFPPMHYAYLGKWGVQILFLLTGYGLLVWWVIDLFRLPGLVKNYNKDIATAIMCNLKARNSPNG